MCLDAENVVRRYFASASVLRLAGLYGPERLLARVQSLRDGEPISGDPDTFLNLIHVDDAVQAVLACEERGETGDTYLACDSRPVTRRTYYEKLAALTAAASPRFETLSSSLAIYRPVPNKRCSNRRLRDELRVELTYPSIEEGLPQALGL